MTVDPKTLKPGVYSGVATVSTKDSSASPVSVRVRLTVNAAPPDLGATEPKSLPEVKRPEAPPKKEEAKKVTERAGKTVEAPPPVPEVKRVPEPVAVAPPPNPEPHKEPMEPAVDCHASDYGGLSHGAFRWAGVLKPQETVTIDRHNKVSSGPAGRVTGDHLPGCEVSIDVKPAGFTCKDACTWSVTPPDARNHFGAITIKNPNDTPIPGPMVTWRVK